MSVVKDTPRTRLGMYVMDGKTPITLAGARYSDRESAVADFHVVWDARADGDFDHTAVAVSVVRMDT